MTSAWLANLLTQIWAFIQARANASEQNYAALQKQIGQVQAGLQAGLSQVLAGLSQIRTAQTQQAQQAATSAILSAQTNIMGDIYALDANLAKILAILQPPPAVAFSIQLTTIKGVIPNMGTATVD